MLLYSKKSHSCGIRGKARAWLESYLNNRKPFCYLSGQQLKARYATCGIPQGSCLGPLPFSMSLNDLEKHLKFFRAGTYADDINITIAWNNVVTLV